MFPDGTSTTCMILRKFAGLDLYYAGHAEPLMTAAEELDHLDHDLSVRGLQALAPSDWATRTSYP